MFVFKLYGNGQQLDTFETDDLRKGFAHFIESEVLQDWLLDTWQGDELKFVHPKETFVLYVERVWFSS